jgi:Domain of unknown function (DUF4293)
LIQRIQTIWLLLGVAAAALMYRLPLWSFQRQGATEWTDYVAPESLLLLTMVTGVLVNSAVNVFLFRNRPLQKKLCILGIILALLILTVEVMQVEEIRQTVNPASGRWQLGALMPMLMIVFLVLAFLGIRKDDALIKSLDRLR